jgi:hypothetical protein
VIDDDEHRAWRGHVDRLVQQWRADHADNIDLRADVDDRQAAST